MQPKTVTKRKFRCIVVDDSNFARKRISKAVAAIGGEVIGEAVNGREAIDLFAKVRPEIVLMDITMPEMDGIETLKHILAKDPEAKVIMVSSVGHKEMVWKAMRIGAKHFIGKPFTPTYALEVISSVLEGGEQCATSS